MLNNWDSLAQQAYMAIKQRKHYEELETRLLNQLKLMSGFKTVVGDRFILVKEARKGNIVYQIIPELVNVDLDLYRKPNINIWKLTEK